MSTDAMNIDTPKKSKKSKDKSERSSSKKRRREEQSQRETEDPATEKPDESSTPKPSKKRRKSGKAGIDGDDSAEAQAPASTAEEETSKEDLSTARKSKKKRKSDQAESIPGTAEDDAAQSPDSSRKRKSNSKDIVNGAHEVSRSSPSIAALPTPDPEVTITSSSTTYLNKGQIQKHTPFAHETASVLLPLAPAAFDFPIQGLCAEHLSPLLLTYYPPLDGIVLSYSRPRLSNSATLDPPYIKPPPSSALSDPTLEPSKPDSSADDDLTQPPSDTESEVSLDVIIDGTVQRDPTTGKTLTKHQKRKSYSGPLALAQTVDEYNTPFAWLTADFVLLRPERGVYLQGVVQVQNPSWLGLVCWNYFNAGIPRRRLPRGWRWVDAARVQRVKPRIREGEVVDLEAEGEEGEEQQGEGDEVVEVDKEGVVVDASGGFWVDESGRKVQGLIEFRLVDFESAPSTERERGFVSITGTLLSEEEDAKVEAEGREERKEKGKKVVRSTE